MKPHAPLLHPAAIQVLTAALALALPLLLLPRPVFATPAEIVSEPIQLRLRAGETRSFALDLSAMKDQEGRLRVELQNGKPLPPSIGLTVQLGRDFPPVTQIALAELGDRPLLVTATAQRRWSDLRAEARLLLTRSDPSPAAGGESATRRLEIPLAVLVEGSPQRSLVPWLVALTVLVTILYTGNMVTNTHLLSLDGLTKRLIPQQWGEMAGHVVDQRGKASLAEKLRYSLAWHRRARAWLRANPLLFGLPWRSYHETLSLRLGTRPGDSWFILEPQSDFPRLIADQPGRWVGRLFACAKEHRRVQFLAVPGDDRRLEKLVIESSTPRSPSKPSCLQLEKATLGRLREEGEPLAPGDPSGWKIRRR